MAEQTELVVQSADLPELPVREAGEPGMLEIMQRAEIDQQIATAKRYPRSLQAFRNEALAMLTLNQDVAREAIYALPREGKIIEGPSVRFAEIIASAWGNCRVAARVIDVGQDFVTAQGVFIDLQRNHYESTEVRRRITDRKGRRYSDDMIGVTANAACAIARRNAIFAGIPKAFWADHFERTRAVIAGDVSTLEMRRKSALETARKAGIPDEKLFAIIGVKGKEDLGVDELVKVSGILTALKDGDTTLEELLGPKEEETKSERSPAAAARDLLDKREGKK